MEQEGRVNLLVLIAVIIASVLILIVADRLAVSTAASPADASWLTLVTEIVFIGSFGVITGRLLLRKGCFIMAFGPIIYFGMLSILMHNAMFIWLDSRMLLTTIASLTGALLGYISNKCD